ncbi:AAA family ATPase [Romboutsia lituseburensis]|uniref:5-methylcytosine-specific restriction enzyme B n=1 Tax=Romboutsia lituseburensis DSM 797 TaxID=1121325 RepID=A0A1G9MPB7_9FIRM|nr:AAA family ATPase [Romboutsia lituseburensis]CEH34378.1 ATPase protein [Romboutsia lituseburensis]SDL75933.1 5-methylcytosine-specific restriction enzyme B [Romboutsia lituseburensis DSM 797]
MEDIDYKIWGDFYQEFANKILQYKNNRKDLITIIRKVYDNINIKLPTLEKENNIVDIDPFTVFGLFNKGIKDENRTIIITEFAKLLNINLEVPTDFSGIPLLNNMSSTFYKFEGYRKEDDIDNLWKVFEYAIKYDENQNDEDELNLINYYDKTIAQKGVKWKLSMGLFWIRPYRYINLDEQNRTFICNEKNNLNTVKSIFPNIEKGHVPNGKQYIDISNECKRLVESGNYKFKNFIEMSHCSWSNKSNNLPEDYIVDTKEGDDAKVSSRNNQISKNTILYGPPGTGKTYNVCNKALEIIDHEKYKDIINNPSKRDEVVKEFNKLKEDGLIGFCTFHQSYSYEDFVEGLRSNGSGGFEPKDGIFKQICESTSVKAQTELPKYEFDQNQISVHKMSLGDTSSKEDNIYEYCIKNNCISLGWGENIDYSNCNDRESIKQIFKENFPESSDNSFDINAINRFKHIIQEGDLVIISQGNHKARAIGKITGDYYYDSNTEIRYNHFRKVEWLYNGEAIDVKRILKDKVFSQQSIYTFYNEDLKFDNIKELISEKPIENKAKNYVLIIDEINRGNISKIFGELITLIEEDKRIGERNELKVSLPYSNESFGVPNNLYIIGTMNTADRSIALLDTALRRRFDFEEYMPNEELLSKDVEGVNVSKLLKTINDRIEFLLDRDHTIGHTYFIKDNLTFEDLVSIMKNKIIPLLQEYFYDDFEKIEMVLGGSGKAFNNNYLLNKTTIKASSLFKTNQTFMYPDQVKYSVVENPSREAFIRIYDDIKDEALDNTTTLDGE